MIDTNISQGFQTLDDVFAAVGATSHGSSQTPQTTHTADLNPDRMKPAPPVEVPDYDPPTPPDYP